MMSTTHYKLVQEKNENVNIERQNDKKDKFYNLII